MELEQSGIIHSNVCGVWIFRYSFSRSVLRLVSLLTQMPKQLLWFLIDVWTSLISFFLSFLFPSATVQASFRLQEPVSMLVQHIGRLEYDIYGEIGVPYTKVCFKLCFGMFSTFLFFGSPKYSTQTINLKASVFFNRLLFYPCTKLMTPPVPMRCLVFFLIQLMLQRTQCP